MERRALGVGGIHEMMEGALSVWLSKCPPLVQVQGGTLSYSFLLLTLFMPKKLLSQRVPP